MNRRYFLAGAAAAGCSRDRRPRLNVFNWSSYIAKETVPDFEREYGARVRYSNYESNEEMLAKAITGNSGWDVVFPTHYYIGPMLGNNLLARLNHARLPHLGALETMFQSPVWDPRLEYSVPYMWNGTGILFSRALSPAPAAWADLWSRRLKGRLTMLDDPMEVLGASLKKLGYSWNATDPGELRRAQFEAIAQKPLIRAYLNAEVRDQLLAGDVLAAEMWTNVAQLAVDDSKGTLGFLYPTEGFPLYCDNAVILRESRRPELAHLFLDYLLRPEVAAANAAAAKTATANAAGRKLLPASVRDNPSLYPPPEVLSRSEWAKTLPPATQRLRDRLWTEIKSA